MTREERKQWYYEQTHKIIDGVVYKQCSKCGEWKLETIEYFYMRNKSKPELGFCSECSDCTRKDSLNYHYENRDGLIAKKRIWYQENREKEIERDRQHRLENLEYHQMKDRKWRENNPEKTKKYSIYRYLHKKHNINNQEWENCKKYFDYKCAYCGLPIEEHYYTRNGITKLGDFHKEHFNHNGSNGLENCVPSCENCNSSKRKKNFEEWYNINNPRHSIEKYDKIIKWIIEDHKLYIEEKKPKRIYKRKNKIN